MIDRLDRDAVEQLADELDMGCLEHEKRWSGDTHADLGGPIREEETDQLMAQGAEKLRALLAEREALEAQNRDLLEALVWAMSEIHGSTRYDDQSQFENCCDKASAAIAKARGEA